MQINPNAPAIAQHQLVIHATPERVWQLLTDIDRWSTWQSRVTRAALSGPLAAGSTFRWKSGGSSIVSQLQEVEPFHRISWTGKSMGARATHVWVIVPIESGVLVRTEESFEGFVVVLLKGMMQKMLETTLRSTLEELKSAAETQRG